MTHSNHRVAARLELLPELYILHIYLFIELTHPDPLIPKHTHMHDGACMRVSKICSQGSSEFTSQLFRSGDGTPTSILNKVIFIWRLNLDAASTPAAVYSSRIMDMVSCKLQQKNTALNYSCSLYGTWRGSPVRYPCFWRYNFQLLFSLWLTCLVTKRLLLSISWVARLRLCSCTLFCHNLISLAWLVV